MSKNSRQPRFLGASRQIISGVCEAGVPLRAAPVRITYPDIPVPFSPSHEHAVLPNAEKVVTAIQTMMKAK
jgi:pyruvate/2-oxoglutarate/acetoin dehydrogenase E1 component